MRLSTVAIDGRTIVAGHRAEGLVDLPAAAPELPRTIAGLLSASERVRAEAAETIASATSLLDPSDVRWQPVVPRPPKIICVGLNYRDHSAESGFEQPDYPTLFARFASSLVAHDAPIVRPRVSEQLDYEGEVAAIIGRSGRHIPRERALEHVAGYSLFNDGSVRDYQTKAPQWTVGKNFDGTGAFGPTLVTADELPSGLEGLTLTTRLNGEVVQQASLDDLVFPVADLIAIISEAITLEPGDVIVTGTPAGVGLARKPPLWMKADDVVEVEVVGIGILRNPVADEAVEGPAQETSSAERPRLVTAD